jgi:hypothetical protein
MAYDRTRDPFANGGAVTAQARRCYAIAAAADELPVYPKALDIYVPDGVEAEITLVYIDDGDADPVTKTYPPGRHLLAARVRRVTGIVGDGVEVHAEV